MNYNALEKLFRVKDHDMADRLIEEINDRRVLDIKFQTGGTANTEKKWHLH